MTATHGGRREGSGRKPLPPDEKSARVAIRIPKDIIDLIDALPGKSRSDKILTLIKQTL